MKQKKNFKHWTLNFKQKNYAEKNKKKIGDSVFPEKTEAKNGIR